MYAREYLDIMLRALREPSTGKSSLSNGRRQNNFDSLRFIGALAVLISHSFSVAYGADAVQPLGLFSNHQTNLGALAVLMFFVISGYLITKSFDTNPDPARFMKARALRIFPALFAILVLSVLIGSTVTKLKIHEYFAHHDTYLYVIGGMSLRYMQYTLPGVFTSNPGGGMINASLWTLYFEFVMYIGVLVGGMAGLLTRTAMGILFICAWTASTFLTDHSYLDLGVHFLGGSLFYLWRERIPQNATLATISLVAMVLALRFDMLQAASSTFGVYLVLYIALTPSIRLPNFARWGDLSYGIYIFSYPVQQLIAFHLGSAVTWYLDALWAIPVVLILAFVSWHFIERPALSLVSQTKNVLLPGTSPAT